MTMLRTNRLLIAGACVALATVVVAASPGASAGAVRQDAGLSGSWTREPSSPAQGSGNAAGFGPRVTITQTGSEVTVRPAGGVPVRYRADGREDVQVVSTAPCARQTRITRTTPGTRGIRISAWLVRQNGCGHGESNLFRPEDSEDRPQVTNTSVGGVIRTTMPTRTLEGVTTISVTGDRLTVETTRPLPNGTSQTTTTTYHR